jgi:hypothetical protein
VSTIKTSKGQWILEDSDVKQAPKFLTHYREEVSNNWRGQTNILYEEIIRKHRTVKSEPRSKEQIFQIVAVCHLPGVSLKWGGN